MREKVEGEGGGGEEEELLRSTRQFGEAIFVLYLSCVSNQESEGQVCEVLKLLEVNVVDVVFSVPIWPLPCILLPAIYTYNYTQSSMAIILTK